MMNVTRRLELPFAAFVTLQTIRVPQRPCPTPANVRAYKRPRTLQILRDKFNKAENDIVLSIPFTYSVLSSCFQLEDKS